MATFLSSSLFNGNSHFRINLYYEYVWQNAATNQSCIRTHLYMQSTDGYSGSGAPLSCAINGNSFSSISSIGVNQEVELGWRDDVYTHDVNGNISINPSGSCSSAWGIGSASTSAWVALARLALAPPWAGSTVDTITPTTARLGNEISGYGHGTSCAMRMYWKKTTDGSWSQTEIQSDASGYNHFNISGLKPNTTYQYFGRQWNNNGDTSDGTAQTFKTKGVAGMLPILMALLQG